MTPLEQYSEQLQQIEFNKILGFYNCAETANLYQVNKDQARHQLCFNQQTCKHPLEHRAGKQNKFMSRCELCGDLLASLVLKQ